MFAFYAVFWNYVEVEPIKVRWPQPGAWARAPKEISRFYIRRESRGAGLKKKKRKQSTPYLQGQPPLRNFLLPGWKKKSARGKAGIHRFYFSGFLPLLPLPQISQGRKGSGFSLISSALQASSTMKYIEGSPMAVLS